MAAIAVGSEIIIAGGLEQRSVASTMVCSLRNITTPDHHTLHLCTCLLLRAGGVI